MTTSPSDASAAQSGDASYVLSHPNGPFHKIDLLAGSLVVEKYIYGTRSGGEGVQWLAQGVDKDGNLLLHRACRTRKEALEVLANVR